MKKKFIIIATIIVCVIPHLTNGQGGIPGNFSTGTNFLGFTTTPPLFPQPLNIRNDFNQPMTLNTSLAGITPLERMRLNHLGPGALLNPGFPPAFAGVNPYPGNTLTRIGIPIDGSQPITRPLSLLHLGYNWPVPGIVGGFRSWMNIGLGMMEGTDNLYFGLREKNIGADPTGRTSQVTAFQSDNQDAVINWGDNTSGAPTNPNNLTFIFASVQNNAASNTLPYHNNSYGREVARMTPEGNFGVGPQFFDNAQPQNMIHINNDAQNAANLQITNSLGTGQTFGDGFHLGITAGTSPAGAIAELRQRENSNMSFFTNNLQRMVILNGNANAGGRIGINAAIPANRLEITSNIADPQPAGLRFTNLLATSPTVPNPGLGVLSVNLLGDVIYVPGGIGTSVANNGLSVSGGVVQLGVPCPTTAAGVLAAQLLTDRQIPMNNFNFVFTDPIKTAPGNRVGIGTGCFPGNKLEVNNSLPGTISGVRLTDLAGQTGAPPSNNNVLSVNLAGDIILTTVPISTVVGGTALGNACTATATPNPLTSNWQIPLNAFQFHFQGQSLIQPVPGPQQDLVAIGYACGAALPVAKFNVLEQQTIINTTYETYGGYFKNANSLNPNLLLLTGGVYGESKAATGITTAFGAINAGGVFEGWGTLSNVGVVGRMGHGSVPAPLGSPGRYAIGGAFMSDSITTNNFGQNVANYGVYARAKKSSIANYGVYSEVQPGNTNPSYAIYGETNNPPYIIGPPPPGPLNPTYAGYFNGDVYIAGSYGPSDQMLKQNIDTIPNALGLINALKPKKFDFNQAGFPSMTLPSGLQYGLIAQQVQTVIPAIVTDNVHPPKYDNMGNLVTPQVNFKGLEYQQIIPILIRAVQQLSSQVNKQDSLIQILTQNINNCCENNDTRITGIKGNDKNAVKNLLNIELSDKDVIVLNQNVPNPFAEQTVITYNIPEKYNFAQIIFKTIEGKIIRTIDIDKKGQGRLNVFANDLSNGLYLYTLIVDGKIIDSKKMVKEN